jgi:septum site-determining protein MinD
MSKVFLISGNAGQGKTTLAKNLAFSLRNFGYDVLLVDADLKTPKLGHHVGMPLAGRTIQDVLLGYRKLEDCLYRTPAGTKLLLSNLEEVKCPHPVQLLPQLRKIADIVIIDVPSHDQEWYDTKCETILLTQPDFPSVLELNKLSKNIKVKGVIVNKTHDEGHDLSIGNINEILPFPILGVIPDEPLMREALRHGYSLVEFHPELKTSTIIKQIAAKLMNIEYVGSLKKKSFLEII